jgi:hypothetical protein
MSRLSPFPSPLTDPLARFLRGNAFAGGLAPAAREPSVSDLLPPLDPAAEQSQVGRLMEGSLGGLAYLGKLADKTFGGRAVRGALGGNPGELLSVLPMSDTLGLTSEADAVSGRQLLQNAGLVDAGEPGSLDAGDVAGFAAEMALDPSTYLGFGPLTRAGALAKSAGGLPRTLAQRLGGFAARESDVLPLARSAGMQVSDVMRDMGLAGQPVMSRAAEDAYRAAAGTVSYADPLTGLTQTVRRTPAERAGMVFDPLQQAMIPNPAGPATPLAGLLGVGLPFSKPAAILGEGQAGLGALQAAAKVAAPFKAADRLIDAWTGLSPARTVGAAVEPVARVARGLFDPEVKGAYSRQAQEVARDVITPQETAREADALGQWVGLHQRLAPVFEGRSQPEIEAALRGIVNRAEGVGDVPLVLQAAPQAIRRRQASDAAVRQLFAPAEVGELDKVADDVKSLLGNVRQESAKLGVNEPELVDSYIQYLTRQKAVLPRAKGESLFAYQNRALRDYAAEHASQIGREELFKDVPGGTAQINDWAKDPNISGPGRLVKNDAQVRSYLRQELTGMANPPKDNPAWSQAERLTDWLKGLPEEHARQGVDFFSLDVPNNVLSRLNRAARADTAANAVMEAAVRFAGDRQAIEAAGDVAVPVADVFKRAKLGEVPAATILSNRLSVHPQQTKDLYLPQSMVADLQRVNEAWQNPKALAPVVQAWDYATNLFKGLVTAPFVSFHTRNLMSNVFNMWRGGVFGNDPRELARVGGEAMSVIRGGKLAKALPGMPAGVDPTAELLKEAVAGRVAFGTKAGVSSDLLGAGGETVLKRPELPRATGKSLAGDAADWARGLVPEKGHVAEQLNPLNVRGVNRDEDVFTVMKQARAAGSKIEDWSRLTHYIGMREKGFTPAAAAAEVHKYQVDYRNLAPAEKNVMKRLFPWYAFSRRNLPPLLEDLAEQPGKITAPLRATSGLREKGEFVPQYVAEGASVPLPGAPEGQQRYITGFGLPIEDEAVKTLGALSQGDLSRAAQQALGMTQPFIKAPLEFAFGKQLYSGRALEDLKPYELASAGGLLDDRQARILTQLVANTPASRASSTVNKLMDFERKGIPAELANLLSGVRVSDVDVEKARDAAAKDVIGGMLRGQPGVRTTSDVYIPKERIPGLPTDELSLYKLYLNADQRLRDRAAARRAAAPGG